MVEASDKKEKAGGKLLPNERYWVDQYEFLKSRGYLLRPRYQPGFKPDSEETSLALAHTSIMDAVQAQTGRKVCLKRMSAVETLRSREVVLDLPEGPDNHCAPILNFIPTETEGERIAVMPFLREFDTPAFATVGEILEAMDQFMQGLDFLHRNNIAHRDACWGNMMMDGSKLIPEGWHIVRPWTQDGDKPISSVPRSSVEMKYYWIDFELSVSVDPSDSNPTAEGVVGQDRTVPEFKDPNASYDPFKLDVYQLGNAFQTRLLDFYDGLEFLVPLITTMTRQEPAQRPTVADAREMLQTARKDVDEMAPVALKPGIKLIGDTRTKQTVPKQPKAKKDTPPLKARIAAGYRRAVGAARRLLRLGSN